MHIILLEPYMTGSHRQWADGYQAHSAHQVEILSMTGHHWKWRMHGGAVELADAYRRRQGPPPDLILATDMLDLGLFMALTRTLTARIPVALYMHENQLNYPWSGTDPDVKLKRDAHYAFINFSAALTADHVFFNSAYHHCAFLDALPEFLRAFPDYHLPYTVEQISAKSSVLSLGMDLTRLDTSRPAEIMKQQRALILWNHRWEYDKGPDAFFQSLFEISDRGIDFKLVVLGEQYDRAPPVFAEARDRLSQHILHIGYAADFSDYARWLWEADILPVTSVQDFFGASVVEAMYCNTVPFLPNRLAYPEHIPSALHHTFFYEPGDFVDRLQKRIMDVKLLRIQNTRQWVQQYDWAIMAPIYDTRFVDLIAR